MDSTRPLPAEPATTELLGPVGDGTCAACHAPLASDQRYCVNCGERRGKARFSFETLITSTPASVAAPPPRRRARASASTTLVAGVGTLLLAIGLGFLIGHNNNSSTPVRASAAAPQVIKIDGGGGSGASSTTSSGSSKPAHAAKAATSAGLAGFKAPPIRVSAKQAAVATSAANKVLGSSANRLAPATVQPGQACAHGAGCQNGKFTGNFFGP